MSDIQEMNANVVTLPLSSAADRLRHAVLLNERMQELSKDARLVVTNLPLTRNVAASDCTCYVRESMAAKTGAMKCRAQKMYLRACDEVTQSPVLYLAAAMRVQHGQQLGSTLLLPPRETLLILRAVVRYDVLCWWRSHGACGRTHPGTGLCAAGARYRRGSG